MVPVPAVTSQTAQIPSLVTALTRTGPTPQRRYYSAEKTGPWASQLGPASALRHDAQNTAGAAARQLVYGIISHPRPTTQHESPPGIGRNLRAEIARTNTVKPSQKKQTPKLYAFLNETTSTHPLNQRHTARAKNTTTRNWAAGQLE